MNRHCCKLSGDHESPPNNSSPWLYGDMPLEATPVQEKRTGGEKSNVSGDIRPKNRLYQTSAVPAEVKSQSSLGPMAQSARSMQSIPVSTRKKLSSYGEPDQEITMDALQEAAAAHAQFSVRAIADRKQRQLGSAIKSVSSSDIFPDSVILSKDAAKV